MLRTNRLKRQAVGLKNPPYIKLTPNKYPNSSLYIEQCLSFKFEWI